MLRKQKRMQTCQIANHMPPHDAPPPPDDPDLRLVRMLPQARPATKAERTFRELVDGIARKRASLKVWQAYELRYNRRLVDDIDPLQTQLHQAQRQWVILIDDLLDTGDHERRLGRTHRLKLKHLLLDVIGQLLENGRDEALEALHDKYSDVSHEEARRSEMAMAQSLLSDVFGLDVGDDHGATTTDELLRHAQRKLEERAQADDTAADEDRAPRDADRAADNPRRDAALARRERAAKDVSQSLRDVYRKLASVLHPDREQDADARQRKTLLMQRVNQAYGAKDLLTLLNLQLEIEQIAAEHLTSITPKRLTHYNKILREQLVELEAELESLVRPFRYSIGSNARATLTPEVVDQHLNASVAQLRRAIRQVRDDLVGFRNPLYVRGWLEQYESEPNADDPLDREDLMQRFAGLVPEPREKTRRRR